MLCKKKSISEIKNTGKSLIEHEDELRDNICSNIIMVSKINIQFNKIQRLIGEEKLSNTISPIHNVQLLFVFT